MIITDGIDVRECGFFHPEYDEYCHIALAFSEDYGECMECKDNPDCYFKQLKRIEAENKILQEKLKCALKNNANITYLRLDISDLKAENEELKEELKQLHNGRTTEELYTLFGKPIKCWLGYKQALEEIEEICKMNCENCQYNPNWNNQDCECEFTDECEEIKIKDIIHKINEVLKDE